MSNEITKAIREIDPDATFDYTIEQLKNKFPNIPSPGFEGYRMRVWVEGLVEASRATRKENHEQTSGGHPTAVEEHSTGDPLVNTEGLSGSKANVAVASNSEPWESKVTDEQVTDGCVLQCLNRILRGCDREEVSAADLRKYLAPIIEKATRDGTLESVFGEDNLLGDLYEDEAVVGQVRLLLKDLCGDGNYKFERSSPDAINTTSGFLLVQGCLERVTQCPDWHHHDMKDGQNYKQLVQIDPEIAQDHDKEWMHTIVILPRESDGSQRFWCHNLAADWGDGGVCMKHLGLKSNGQPLCGGYYLRFISRVYKIDIRERPSKKAKTSNAEDPIGEQICKGVHVITQNFARDVLGFDAGTLPKTLIEKYPKAPSDNIEACKVQLVHGNHPALNKRSSQKGGSGMPRHKYFFQTGDPKKDGILKYGYTGRQLRIGLLTADVGECPEIAEILEKYNEFAASKQYPAANYIIVTIYENGQDHIDEHSDKTKDFDDNSLLTVVKLGPGERSFVIRDGKGGKELFNKKLPVGSAVLMTVPGNNSTTHEVPIDGSTQLSGSIVFRTITTREPFEKVCKAVQNSDPSITKYVKFFHEGQLLNPLSKPRVDETIHPPAKKAKTV